MELNELYQFVLLIVLVGMVIGVGVMVTDRFGSVTFYSISNFNNTIAHASLTNNTLVALAHGNITSVDLVQNTTGSVTYPSQCYEINSTYGQFSLRNVSADCHLSGSGLTLLYDYKEYETATRDAMSSVGGEIKNISTNWLGLIVTVAILSMVLFLVVRSFGGFAGR